MTRFSEDFVLKIGRHYPNMFTLVDKTQPDQPLIYVNRNFESFTGYQSCEVIGKNCRFLQENPNENKTHLKLVNGLRDYVENCVDCVIDLKNFKKNGTVFYNRLCIIHFGEKYCIGLQNNIRKLFFNDVSAIPTDVISPFLNDMNQYFESCEPREKIKQLSQTLAHANERLKRSAY